jgi:mannitol-1-/sugar-/sorbitol-6-phosphatase
VSSRARDDSALAGAPVLGGAQALLVDLDGTLVDSSGPVTRAWTAFAKRHGLDPDEVQAFAQGRPSSQTVRVLAPSADHDVETALVEAAETTDTDGVLALPGAADLLRSGYPLAIVTSCSSQLADVRLRAAGLPRPEVVISSSMVMRGKPDPEGFLLGARRLNTTVERCAVLEDSPVGIDAGHAAGARVIALRTTHGDHALARADATIDNLAALFTRSGPPCC